MYIAKQKCAAKSHTCENISLKRKHIDRTKQSTVVFLKEIQKKKNDEIAALKPPLLKNK
jgi:fibrillarin-like rRNA methylase